MYHAISKLVHAVYFFTKNLILPHEHGDATFFSLSVGAELSLRLYKLVYHRVRLAMLSDLQYAGGGSNISR